MSKYHCHEQGLWIVTRAFTLSFRNNNKYHPIIIRHNSNKHEVCHYSLHRIMQRIQYWYRKVQYRTIKQQILYYVSNSKWAKKSRYLQVPNMYLPLPLVIIIAITTMQAVVAPFKDFHPSKIRFLIIYYNLFDVHHVLLFDGNRASYCIKASAHNSHKINKQCASC